MRISYRWKNCTDRCVECKEISEQYRNIEMSYIERIVSLYLEYVELQAERQIPMSMENWAKCLDGFLEFNGNKKDIDRYWYD